MEWQTIDSAPMDGSIILVWDGFGVMWATFHPEPTFEDFECICDEGEGEDEYKQWIDDLRNDPDDSVKIGSLGLSPTPKRLRSLVLHTGCRCPKARTND